MMRFFLLFTLLFLENTGVVWQSGVQAQSLSYLNPGSADLASCLKYALDNQPLVQQLYIRDEVSRHDIAIALSDWLPQAEFNAGFQQFIRQPVSIFPDFTNPSGPKREITTGVKNTSSVQFSANQVIYNPDVLLASRVAKFYRRQSAQTIRENKIDLVVLVSKAFYDVLLTNARLDFLREDYTRTEKSMKDARSLYETGVNDKIDFQRAMISLNNIKAEILGTGEEINAKQAYLKELMGYPHDRPLILSYDSATMMEDTWIDTTGMLNVNNRIEYQLLLTKIYLQKSAVGYQKLAFLPSLSAYAQYNLIYQNDEFNSLYEREFPNSSVGLRLTMPLFEGTRRIHQVKRANLLLHDMALDTLNLKRRMITEYERAIALYKTNLKALVTARENSRIANDIYNTVRLQYNQGIKSYLEVIVSEADLRSSRISEFNSLYRLLTSKLDVERALGIISVNNE